MFDAILGSEDKEESLKYNVEDEIQSKPTEDKDKSLKVDEDREKITKANKESEVESKPLKLKRRV